VSSLYADAISHNPLPSQTGLLSGPTNSAGPAFLSLFGRHGERSGGRRESQLKTDPGFERGRRLLVAVAWTFGIHDVKAGADRVGELSVFCA